MIIEYDFGDYEVESWQVVESLLINYHTETLAQMVEQEADWKALAKDLECDELAVSEELRKLDRSELEEFVKAYIDEDELAESMYEWAYDYYYWQAKEELTGLSDLAVNGWGEI